MLYVEISLSLSNALYLIDQSNIQQSPRRTIHTAPSLGALHDLEEVMADQVKVINF
jgi:hypothetical protein